MCVLMMKLSIIIVNYNTCNLLCNCLASLQNTISDIEYEVIVVDNASTDKSLLMLAQEFPQVRVVVNNFNVGFARANNQGVNIAKGKYVLLLNSDTLVLGDCIFRTIAFAENITDAGVISCKVLNKDKSLQYSTSRFPCFFTELVFYIKSIFIRTWDPFSHWRRMKGWDHKQVRCVDSVSGCFFLVRTSVYKQLGGLDEKIFMYCEDTDFCKRVKECGLKTYYYPNASIIHLGGGSATPENKASIILHCFKAWIYYYKKHASGLAVVVFLMVCKLIWFFELIFVSIFAWNKKVRNKIYLLVKLLFV
jgi:GT2 family glycosyltransferase